ncbi:tripartite tricarboxylate transporter substrate binding protein [Roseomonas hellenica]|uniref:Tripartite tricarboxylate transporter substrate binding protein n=1 Tax=Plastoroseomonas hellenica TaxID=2687306 RepID=A0ABS5F1P6_9PROT|nr:tripartite tricarboxylate transporter substrate binding protein [Plastoroseomonas hellenica]MBR0666463.1 tripartite tricarboxylate transporter substrate binding protein [Plastoroseomonas hellenica]
MSRHEGEFGNTWLRTLPRRAALAAPALLLAGRAARADWPMRPIRLIVAFPAGSATDVLARVLSEPLSQELGRPVVVDNRAGGNGIIGTQAAVQAVPDGYTFVVISTSAASINPHTLRQMPFDPVRDLVHVGALAEAPYMFVVPPGAPDTDLGGFFQRARQRPGGLTYSHGNASSMIMTEVLARGAGAQLTAVPYRGGAEALTDVAAGRIDCTFTDMANGVTQSQTGRVRALAHSGKDPTPLAPGLPAAASVVPGYDIKVWFGISAPAATPVPIVARANQAINAVLQQTGVVDRLRQLGFLPFRQTPEQFGQYLREQLRVWGEHVRVAGVEPQ